MLNNSISIALRRMLNEKRILIPQDSSASGLLKKFPFFRSKINTQNKDIFWLLTEFIGFSRHPMRDDSPIGSAIHDFFFFNELLFQTLMNYDLYEYNSKVQNQNVQHNRSDGYFWPLRDWWTFFSDVRCKLLGPTKKKNTISEFYFIHFLSECLCFFGLKMRTMNGECAKCTHQSKTALFAMSV